MGILYCHLLYILFFFKRCQRAVFPPLHSLTLCLQLRSRSLRAQKAVSLTLPIPSAFRHRPPDPPHTPAPQSRGPEPPCGKTPASPRPASHPEPCPKGRAASAVRPSSLRKIRCGSHTADPPTRRPRGRRRKQSGRESQPQAPDTPCPLSALRASRPPSAGMPRAPRPLIRYLT